MGNDSDIHALVCKLKDVAIELGRVPTRMEFVEHTGISRWTVGTIAGGYKTLLDAAGLKPEKARKINNSIFETSISRHLEQYEPREVVARKRPWPKIAVISDMHWPFVCQRVLDAFYLFIEKHRPDYVIIVGDAWDQYSHSKFSKSINIFSPREEQARAREMNEIFWREVKKRCPSAKCIQMLGNHDIRPLKRVLEAYPAAEDWIERAMKEMFTFDGVETIHDPRQEYMIDDIAVFHGYRTQLGANRDYTMYNCINGHTHRGGAVFRQIRGQILWELNTGTAGDPESKGLSYTPQKITEQTNGFGWVDEYGPRFIAA